MPNDRLQSLAELSHWLHSLSAPAAWHSPYLVSEPVDFHALELAGATLQQQLAQQLQHLDLPPAYAASQATALVERLIQAARQEHWVFAPLPATELNTLLCRVQAALGDLQPAANPALPEDESPPLRSSADRLLLAVCHLLAWQPIPVFVLVYHSLDSRWGTRIRELLAQSSVDWQALQRQRLDFCYEQLHRVVSAWRGGALPFAAPGELPVMLEEWEIYS